MSQDESFGTIDYNETVTDTTISLNDLDNGTYYWKVMAYDTDSLMTWGSGSDVNPWQLIISASGVANGGIIPQDYCLYSNYPNPFNPTTAISYDIPKVSQVTLTIFNMNGQIVDQLINQKQEPGFYSVQWDARNVSTGVYFYQIKADGFQQVKKMLLIK